MRQWPDTRNQADAARRLGIKPTDLGPLLNMRRWPRLKNGEWGTVAKRIAAQLVETEEYLFDEDLYGRRPSAISIEIDRHALEAAGMFALPPATPEQEAMAVERTEELANSLGLLSPREQRVLVRRYGLDSNGEAQLEEVAKEFGVSKVRIQQIQAKALRKLRHPQRSRRLAAAL